MKNCQIANHFSQSKINICQILKQPSKICPRPLKLCQSGEILQNLVTLTLNNENDESVKKMLEPDFSKQRPGSVVD